MFCLSSTIILICQLNNFMMLFVCTTNTPLSLMFTSCDGCGGDFSLTRPLDSCKDGLITQCHNEFKDALVSLSYWEIVHEPVVCNGIGDSPVDLGIRGVWIPQAEASFDV